MTKIEQKLEQVWGASPLSFCMRCGTPAAVDGCVDGEHAPWASLDPLARQRVRRRAIEQKKRAQRKAIVLNTAS